MAETFLLAAILWLVAVIPAAAITALKGHWLLFITGYFTLGAVWLVGAATLAEPDSWWTRRFYDERKLAQASDRDVRPRPTRVTVATVGSILVALVVLLLFAAYPSPILGVDGKSLEYSVAGSSIFTSKPCRKWPHGTWICSRWTNQGSSQAIQAHYRVTVDGVGCWTATRLGASGNHGRESLSGCITIRDHIRFFDRLAGWGGGDD